VYSLATSRRVDIILHRTLRFLAIFQTFENSMSGLEVIGVVLGALPLIISAFEHGQSLAKKWNLLENFTAENRKVWNDIRDEALMYRLQLKILLAPLVWDGDLENDRLEALMLSPQSNAWREPDVEAALKKRLGEAYDRYIGNVEEIQALAWRLLEPFAQSPAFRAQISNKVRSLRLMNGCELI
jgi:hypothetical protein